MADSVAASNPALYSYHTLINPDLTLPVRVLSFTQISDCNPTQWEGWTEHDQLILVRFRYGRLWIGLTPDFTKTTPITLFVTPYGNVDDAVSPLRLFGRYSGRRRVAVAADSLTRS